MSVVVSSYMLTVPEAARRAGRDPETIRRWIRGGRLRARKVGTQHVIEERDLEALLDAGLEMLPVPERWRYSDSGRSLPNVVAAIRRSRGGR
jgi:excisionase family DNA binding protein